MNDLPIIQKTHDLIKWYVPILNRLPRDHKFMLGDRIITGLYSLLEGFIQARYAKGKTIPVVGSQHPTRHLAASDPASARLPASLRQTL